VAATKQAAEENSRSLIMNFTKLALIATTLSLTTAALSAQTSQEINQHKENQQDRIAQGVKSGQLTADETAHLEKQESAINREEKNMRAQDNGHLTKADKSLINKQQNQESRRIYRDKHNGKKA
jgi:hypothetical protein